MKKLTLLLFVILCFCFTNAFVHARNSKHFTINLIQRAYACTAFQECSDGATIKCTGASSCESGPGWVRCDGNISASC